MIKRIIATALVFAAFIGLAPTLHLGLRVEAASVNAADYTYEIRPILEPFNGYFFVKTENPDPTSFQFIDKDSIYSEEYEYVDENIEFADTYFADVAYENEQTLRVNGGYIFWSPYINTDGGAVTLQVKTGDGWWNEKWVDTNVTLTLPSLCDTCDYLIDTYATKDSFFDNMYAVQNGFRNICLYSGSYIRGKIVEKPEVDYWYVTTRTHVDQSFYILSPYNREDSINLFASRIYPFIYDSLGFPGMMAKVSKRLDSTSSCVWDSYSHAYVNVTYNGETISFGGAGIGDGQGISEDKIVRRFTLDNSETITLEGGKQLLEKYAAVEMKDDIPRENSLKWEHIYNKIGNGSWAKVDGGYSYFYQNNTGDDIYFTADEWGVGYLDYWGGSLGFCSDTWYDGRYININECYVPGATFEDYPEGGITLNNITVPRIYSYNYDYEYDPETGEYVTIYTSTNIDEEFCSHVRYGYDSDKKCWIADNIDYDLIAGLVRGGSLDESYLDTMVLTAEEVAEMNLDYNADKIPEQGLIYDGSVKAGTPYQLKNGIIYADNWVIDCVEECEANLVLPNTVKGIAKEAFYDCDWLVSITIPKGAASIGFQAFAECDELKDVYFDGTIDEWNSIQIDISNSALEQAAIHCKDGGLNTTTTTTKPTTTTKKTTTTTAKPTTTTKKTTTTTAKPTTTTKKTTTTTTKPTTTTKKTTTTTAKPTTTTKKTTTTTAKPTTTTKKTTTTTTKPTTTTKKTTTTTAKPTTTTKKTTTTTAKPTTTTKKTTTTTATSPTTNAFTRLAGTGRCETAVAISKASYKKATNVVIASGDDYADALAGVPLAYALDAPILLIRNHTLDDATLGEITRLGAKNIYILGGEFAVNAKVANTLTGKGYKVTRLAGSDRFGTSLEIAKKLQSVADNPSEIIFVYSHNYPDALAVSGVAAAKNCPVIYIAGTGKLTDGIASFVKSSGAKKATIISGPAIVNSAAEGNIKKAGASTVNRIYGANRYETCIKINEAYANVLTGKAVCVATGTNYPDALAGGVFAATKKAPLVLVDKSLTDSQKKYIKSKNANDVYVFGGTGVVSDKLANEIAKY